MSTSSLQAGSVYCDITGECVQTNANFDHACANCKFDEEYSVKSKNMV